MKILLTEDDTYIAGFIKKGLGEESHIVDHVAEGEEALERASAYEYDLIILDVMLPGMNGIEVCRELRSREIQTPVLILTAKDMVKDKVKGLESGADDYLTKPFFFDEFLARINALCRRKHTKFMELTYGELRLDSISHRVLFKNREIELRPKEYALLYYLLINKDRVLTRTQILENVWGYRHDPSTNIVDVNIKTLRAKLNPFFNGDIITTVRGRGYMLSSILT